MKEENPDFYFNEQGLMVLTKHYLLKRGTCCGKGCKHCPYEYKNVKNPALRKRLLAARKSQ